MKKYFLYILIFIAIGSCKKYPEDSKSLHLETIKCRLAGSGLLKGYKDWLNTDVYDVIKNKDLGYRSSYKGYYSIGFGRKGDFVGYMIPFVCDFGKWELVDKKDKLKITDDKGVALEYTIMKLDNNALWLQNDSLLFKFEPYKK